MIRTNITLLNEDLDLVSYTPTIVEEVDTVLASKRLDSDTFGEIFFLLH